MQMKPKTIKIVKPNRGYSKEPYLPTVKLEFEMDKDDFDRIVQETMRSQLVKDIHPLSPFAIAVHEGRGDYGLNTFSHIVDKMYNEALGWIKKEFKLTDDKIASGIAEEMIADFPTVDLIKSYQRIAEEVKKYENEMISGRLKGEEAKRKLNEKYLRMNNYIDALDTYIVRRINDKYKNQLSETDLARISTEVRSVLENKKFWDKMIELKTNAEKLYLNDDYNRSYATNMVRALEYKINQAYKLGKRGKEMLLQSYTGYGRKFPDTPAGKDDPIYGKLILSTAEEFERGAKMVEDLIKKGITRREEIIKRLPHNHRENVDFYLELIKSPLWQR